MKKSKLFLMFLAIGLIAGAAQATIYDNGDFEDDLALVPNPGDVHYAIPTGWEYSDYYGYVVEPALANVSAVGDGTGGDVGVAFPNWNVDGGWDSCITRYESPIASGQYTYTVTLTGVDMTGGDNWIIAELWWTDNLEDPWAEGHYDYLAGTDWVELTDSDNGQWQTHVMDFEILPDDPAVGNYFSPWIHVQNYDGHMILGEATLVPEPATLCLLGLGGLMLWRRRA